MEWVLFLSGMFQERSGEVGTRGEELPTEKKNCCDISDLLSREHVEMFRGEFQEKKEILRVPSKGFPQTLNSNHDKYNGKEIPSQCVSDEKAFENKVFLLFFHSKRFSMDTTEQNRR
ncbi:hypothetical protein NPIL_433891 [Nephila pilipes]|uniref:Uncharacterized protein n=1 Tax=Nephila pilipes TaxID=299642 RepID=A0A8X6UFH8_NEPPI|nr:hypothetical protein NPIL_433891 [Nephila pilipes]